MTAFVKQLRCVSCICLMVFVCSLLPLRAQSEAFRFERLSLDDGLSQSTVLCIYQDSQGFMWFGTRHGANKYDGYRFTVYAHDPADNNSITDNWVTSISEDRQGNIWVGTRNGLNRLVFVDERGFSLPSPRVVRYRHEPARPNSLSSNTITSIFQDSTGALWVGTNHGLNRYVAGNDTWFRYGRDPNSAVGLSHDSVTDVREDGHGNLWVATFGGGLNRFDPRRENVTHYVRTERHASLQYPQELLSRLPRLLENQKSLAAILKVEDSTNVSTPFELGAEAQVLIVYVGEATDQLFDYGWIEQKGRTVWKPDLDKTRHAGGDAKNRIQLALAILKSGKYSLHYRSDRSHSYGNWNRPPPANPELWGIRVLQISAEEAIELRKKISRVVEPSMISDNFVSAILPDRSGDLWVGTLNRGLDRITPSKSEYEDAKFVNYPLNRNGLSTLAAVRTPNLYVKNICEDSTGAIWLGTNRGLARLNPLTAGVEYYRHDPVQPHSLSTNDVEAVLTDRAGTVWIGTVLGGLNKVYDQTRRFRSYTTNPATKNSLQDKLVYSFHEDPLGHIWIGSRSRLALFEPENGHFSHVTFPRDHDLQPGLHVMAMVADAEDRVWVGTRGRGLLRIHPELLSTRTASETRERTLENAVLNDDKAFLHLTHRPGQPNSLSSNQIPALLVDSKGDLWVGTYFHGLNKLDPQSNTFRRFRHQPRAADGLSSDKIRTIFEDREGIIWVGTDGAGLDRLDLNGDLFSNYRNSPGDSMSLSHDIVTSIYEDGEGVMWIATYGGGLSQLDRNTGRFWNLTQREGLANNVVYGIVEDGSGFLWLSTNKGLSRFDPRTKAFRNYDASDGLQSNEFNTNAYFRSRNGSLYFGGVNGFSVFHPDSLKENTYVPPLSLTSFKVLDRDMPTPLTERHKLQLAHYENSISFMFAALDYNSPENNQYAYKIDGLDEGWIYSGNRRFASYANIGPGNYTLRIKGANSDGVWNETGISMRFTIVPPWWQTWWSRSALLLTLLSAVVLSYRQRINRVQRQKAELEKTVQERTAELQKQRRQAEVAKTTIEAQADKLRELDRMKSRFFANISHEFRTPLTLILGPLDEMISNGFDGKTKRTFVSMRRNGNRLLRLINQLLDLAKLETSKMKLDVSRGDLSRFVSKLTASFQSLAQSQEINLRCRSTVQNAHCLFDRDKIEKIVCNLLSNSLKFTPKGGTVSVRLSPAPDGTNPETELQDVETTSDYPPPRADRTAPNRQRVRITVEDTGVGIPHDRLPFIFDRFYQADDCSSRDHEGTGIGLALTRELVELHEGTLMVESTPNRGSIFTVVLPLEFSEFQDSNWGEPRPESYDCPSATPNSPALGLEARSGGHNPGSNPIVLIVEDNAEVREYLKDSLKRDYQIMEAENGAEGFQKAAVRIPDLVISDVMMPAMNGYDLCDRLKSDERTSHIPVILLTAKASEESKLAGLRTGADDYLSKPVSIKELRVRSNNLIRQRRMLRERFSGQFVSVAEDLAVPSADEVFIKKVCRVVTEHLEDSNFTVEMLVRNVGMSRPQLHRKLRAVTDLSTTEFIRSIRLKRAKQLLDNRAGNITEIAYRVGFNNLSYFSRCFAKQFGCLPSEYEKAEVHHKQ